LNDESPLNGGEAPLLEERGWGEVNEGLG